MRKLLKLIRLLQVPAYRAALLRHGLPAGVEHEAVLSLEDFRSVVDLGANRGQFSFAAKRCCPHARIFAFEPLRAPAERFRKIFREDGRVVLHPVAAGADSQIAQMHVSIRDHSSSLFPSTPLQEAVFPGTSPIGTETVQVERLDSVLKREDIEEPALLKIDVQGYELEALRGCEGLLSAFAHVYVECSLLELYEQQASANDVIRFLAKHRYVLQGIYNSYLRSGELVQGDFLFVRPTGRKVDQ